MNIIAKYFIGIIMTTITSLSLCAENITKSTNDKRDYAYTELNNGLKLLVISDTHAQRSAVAVDVNVGSSAEPDEFPGLAHFLEHMLFLGTDNYPNPDDYINYISEHGGNHNAFTAFDHTNYFFDIDPDHLLEGFKRFSRFFVAPLMSEKYVKRERNAVDSEYQSKLREDNWRNMDVLKQAINPRHPYSRFLIGNNETLPKDKVRPALIDFYNTHYSSDIMSVVIIGREDTETLTTWGKELFSDVPQRTKLDLTIKERIFDGIKLPIEIQNQSVKNEKNISIYFQLPYSLNAEYSKSLGYISYILGYEGKGSLLSALKAQGYATSLYSSYGHPIGDETSFEIGVNLTEKGYENTNNVTALIFAYLELLKNDTKAKIRYNEIATVAKTAFQFKEKHSSINEVSRLATRINRYPLKDIQAINSIFSGYDQNEINDYLATMNPHNVAIQVTAPDITSKIKTKHFQVPYNINEISYLKITKIAEEDKEAVKKMHLPFANQYIAKNYELQILSDGIDEKNQVLENGIELFYKHDISFNVPKVSVNVSMQPTIELSVTDKTAMTLLAGIIDEQLSTELYDASIAGLDVNIIAGEKSIVLFLQGYQQKTPVLLESILNKFKNIEIDPSTFERVKDEYRQNLENEKTKMPYVQTFSHLNELLVTDYSLPEQRLAVLESIDEKSITKFTKQIFSNLAVRILVYGNNTFSEAKKIGNSFSTILTDTNFKHQWQQNSTISINENITKNFKSSHSDSAITFYIQGKKGYLARAQIGLLAKILEPQFFTKLRTEQQLGYVVFAYPKPTLSQSGIAFTIQSPVANSDQLETHVRNFITTFSEQLSDLHGEDFDEYKNILKRDMLQEPENLLSAASLYWSDILKTNSILSSRQAIANEINKIQLEQFVEEMQSLLNVENSIIIKVNPK